MACAAPLYGQYWYPGTITGTWYERTWEGPVKHGLNFETIKLHISITGTVHAHVTRPLKVPAFEPLGKN